MERQAQARRPSPAARIAAARRWHPDEPIPADLACELAESRITRAVEKALADAPPLTPAVRDRLAALLFAAPVRSGGLA